MRRICITFPVVQTRCGLRYCKNQEVLLWFLSNLETHLSQEKVVLISLSGSQDLISVALACIEFVLKLGLRHQKPDAINTDVTNMDIWLFVQWFITACRWSLKREDTKTHTAAGCAKKFETGTAKCLMGTCNGKKVQFELPDFFPVWQIIKTVQKFTSDSGIQSLSPLPSAASWDKWGNTADRITTDRGPLRRGWISLYYAIEE